MNIIFERKILIFCKVLNEKYHDFMFNI